MSEKESRLNSRYEKLRTESSLRAAPSLKSFLRQDPLNHWLKEQAYSDEPWCEIGCGAYSLFEEWRDWLDLSMIKKKIFAFDLSQKAIALAPINSSISYEKCDITHGLPHAPYGFILDGHCLHSLDSLGQVFYTLGLLLKALVPGGYFAGEVMTLHPQVAFDEGYEFNENERVLYHNSQAARVIMEAREWEDLFLTCGFKIVFFVCHGGIKFIPNDRREQPLVSDPECLRFVLQR